MSYIQVDEAGKNTLERVNAVLAGIPRGAFKATYNALKRAGAKAKTEAGRFAAAEYTISKGDFMRNVTEKTKLSGNQYGVAQMNITYSGNVLPLVAFNTSYSRNGHMVTQVKRSGSAAALDHVFAANIFGHLGAYERLGGSRFPVEEKYGPSTAHMMQNEEIIKQMDEVTRETYEQRLEHEILRLLNGWGGR